MGVTELGKPTDGADYAKSRLNTELSSGWRINCPTTKSTAYGKTLLKSKAEKCSLVEFSATALGGETTRAFLLFIPKMRRKRRETNGFRAKLEFWVKKFRLTAKEIGGEKIFKKS